MTTTSDHDEVKMPGYPPPGGTTIVLQVTIDLPHAASALSAIRDLVRAAAEVPGTELSIVDGEVAVPEPREPLDDDLRIDPRSRRVARRDELVELTKLEFDLLHYLCAQPGQVHRRSTLMSRVWGVVETDESPATRTIDVHIRRLRAKLGADGRFIKTVRGVGYRFDGENRVAIGPVC